jgi:hypothetical protein
MASLAVGLILEKVCLCPAGLLSLHCSWFRTVLFGSDISHMMERSSRRAVD